MPAIGFILRRVSQMPQPAALESDLQERLKANPADVEARKQLGNLYLRSARYEQAEEQLSKALALAPKFAEARWLLVGTFVYRGDWQRVLENTDLLLAGDPENRGYLDTKAFALLELGEFEQGAAVYEFLAGKYPSAESCTSYGRALKALGQTSEAIAAYRRALALNSRHGMAWWSLAELKTFRFEPADIDAMAAALNGSDLPPRNRALIQFALGRAFEDTKRYEGAFARYRDANATVRSFVRHNPEQRTAFVRRNRNVFTPEYFRVRSGWGSQRRDPIFIVGLPRSGTTLVEQILASHSLVEAAGELQCLESVVRDLQRRTGKIYPELMLELSTDQITAAGDDYLARTAAYRTGNKPFFIDKMPNNFTYLGMMLTALPNAKIIDVRRHPLGSGFAIFKHYFLDAYSFAFDLASIGRYYRDYVALMAQFHAVAPGRVHRVLYENLVADPEQAIRGLLDHCGLPFEDGCLRFHASSRAVHTPSSEQVRQPISAEPGELWRHYERWLDPLKTALGDVLQVYPSVPDL